jgi:hypothetical protein
MIPAASLVRCLPTGAVHFGRPQKKYWQGGAATLFGIFSPLGALLSVEFQIAVQRLFWPAAYGFGRASWQYDSQSRQQRAVNGGQVRPQASDGGTGPRATPHALYMTPSLPL